MHRVRGALIGALVSVGVGWPVAASAAEATGSQTYSCSVQQALGGGTADAVDVTVALSGLPTTVIPGQNVTLAGTATFKFSPTFVATFPLFLLATEVYISSGSFAPVVSYSGVERPLFADEFVSEKVAIAKSGEVKVPLKLAPFRVADSSAGTVEVVMPSTGLVNTVGTEPADVAFTLEFTTNSPVIGTRNVACWLPEDKPVRLARAAVRGSSPTSPVSTSGSSSGDSDNGLFSDSDSDDDVDSDDELFADSDDDVESASAPLAGTATADQATAGSDAALAATSWSAIPPNTRIAGLFIPGWLVLFAVSVPALGALSFGLQLRRRLLIAEAAAGRSGSVRNRLRSQR